ncbi:MAG TPA: sialidase family protein [Candidatus Sulfotelmatobacter sp.]|nr:sialidase family protein [Candidatus Sulfotelmatobacter sp.]
MRNPCLGRVLSIIHRNHNPVAHLAIPVHDGSMALLFCLGSLGTKTRLAWNPPGFSRLPRAFPALGLTVLLLIFSSCSGSSSPSSPSTPVTPQDPVGPNLTQLSSDPYTIGPGQHATEVEPHMFANGSTLVSAFQTGRIVSGGGTAIGWATSADGGSTWTHGFLPGLTKGEGTGPYDAASDPVVAYDAKHAVWMIASLPLSSTIQAPAVAISRSTDGTNWQSPVSADAASLSSDKNWITCDNWSSSPFFGNCYLQWDDPQNSGQIMMSTSADGGLTWGAATPTANFIRGIGGQPLVQPDGHAVVPIELIDNSGNTSAMIAFSSTDGGASWSAPVTIAGIQFHADAGGIRSGPLPSAAIDGAGTIWVVWEDCRFRSNCSTNDLVYSTSADGVSWSAVTRIPIDPVSSNVDHFIPGIGIDPATSGASAHIGLHYYYYSQSNCSASTCELFVGFISSASGGATWNSSTSLTGPMQLPWLPNSQNGLMVGDYIATAFTNGVPHGVFAVAQANSSTTFKEAIYTGQNLTVAASGRQLSSANDRPLHKLSDKIEREIPERGKIPPKRRLARRSSK